MEPRPGVSKQDIRQQIWDCMESQNLADFPRPVHHRIPNFKGSHLACQNIRDLDVFARTRYVKVDPDKPLEGVRLLALQSQKMLLVPTPRLRTGLFNKITPPPGATKDILRKCATSQGVRSYSSPVGLESTVLVDLVVVGSVAVSEKGWRIGKGEGYADLEYAMMASMGAVTPGTPVATVVHDCQVIDMPEALLEDHDLTVDYVVTPTRVIATGCARPKPTGILWSKISSEMMGKIPVLRSLRYREQRAGKDVALRDEPRPLLVAGSQQPARPSSVRGPRDPPRPEPCSAQQQDGRADTVRREPSLGRPSERAEESRRRGPRRPPEAHVAGPRRWAPPHVQAPAPAQQAASRLQGLCLGAAGETVALGGQQRARDLAGSCTEEPQPECRPAVTDL